MSARYLRKLGCALAEDVRGRSKRTEWASSRSVCVGSGVKDASVQAQKMEEHEKGDTHSSPVSESTSTLSELMSTFRLPRSIVSRFMSAWM